MPGCAELLRSRLRSEPQSPLVVFVWYKETAASLQRALSGDAEGAEGEGADGPCLKIRCQCLTGDLKQQQRQELIDSFQAGDLGNSYVGVDGDGGRAEFALFRSFAQLLAMQYGVRNTRRFQPR